MILREEQVDLDLLVFLSMKTKRNLLIWNKNNRKSEKTTELWEGWEYAFEKRNEWRKNNENQYDYLYFVLYFCMIC